jgi:hypothetical protein
MQSEYAVVVVGVLQLATGARRQGGAIGDSSTSEDVLVSSVPTDEDGVNEGSSANVNEPPHNSVSSARSSSSLLSTPRTGRDKISLNAMKCLSGLVHLI